MRNHLGQFCGPPENRLPIGTVHVRTRYKRCGEKRRFIKIAEPNDWTLLAHWIWKQANGPIPRGMLIHHKDGNSLNDTLDNLELINRAAHLRIHEKDFHAKRITNFTVARRLYHWSTKSATKHTGRPPIYNRETVRNAVASYKRGEGTYRELAQRFGVSFGVIGGAVRSQRNSLPCRTAAR